MCADNLNISVVSVDGIDLGKCSADLRQFPADECRTLSCDFSFTSVFELHKSKKCMGPLNL